MWGIFDPVDNAWIGNDDGPLLFDNQVMARLVSEVCDVMMGYPRRRCIEREFDEGRLKLKDTVELKRSAEQALHEMEDGTVL